MRPAIALLLALSLPTSAHAGLHYSGETFADLPSRWRGFLLDQRLLRTLAVKPPPTARHINGDLAQAAACLEQAVRLSPGKYLKAEQLHLKLVRARLRPRKDAGLDDLFGIRYAGPSGAYEAGKLAPAQRKALPTNAVAQAQLLALWLPADARLLWQ